jgi:flavodoxin
MRTSIVYFSQHHGNTRKIAEAMASAIGADLFTTESVAEQNFGDFDLIGFGSGIYFGRHHAALFELVEKIPALPPHCFVFSTAGLAWLNPVWHMSFVRLLRKRGTTVVGSFCCPGWDTVGPLRLIGGIHRNRPNTNDVRRAAQFARELQEAANSLQTCEARRVIHAVPKGLDAMANMDGLGARRVDTTRF